MNLWSRAEEVSSRCEHITGPGATASSNIEAYGKAPFPSAANIHEDVEDQFCPLL